MRRLVFLLSLSFLLVHPANAVSPGVFLTLTEPTLGQWTFFLLGQEEVTVDSGQLMSFSWIGEPELDGSTVTGYRYGWDLADFYDPDDPGWAYDGLADVTSAPPMSFTQGTHTLTVWVEDDLTRYTVGTLVITVDQTVPVPQTSWGQLKSTWATGR